MAADILHFFAGLQFPAPLPPDVEVMNPYQDAETFATCTRFYHTFYGDARLRCMIIGINPGRFGGGVTGIPFTDPIRLQDECFMLHHWPRKQELSSVFIYRMIRAFGGPEAFYGSFYFTSVSPLGFTKAGKNLNYYDNPELERLVTPFAADCIARQLPFGIHRHIAFCLGEGKNFAFLTRLNATHRFFDNIVPLPHPRFIMQYRLKRVEEYVDLYLQRLSGCNAPA